mgnify:CR=1 FL=1|tara:strand:- start:9636 stop:9938 length:303 start_codon:yes stop_codon:yes gene_type:complete
MKKIFCFLILPYFLVACQATQDALTLQKKNNSDEFLVEKKNPLVLPPNYGELPLPTENKIDDEKVDEIQISQDSGDLKINETIKNSEPSELEKSVLKKIK